MATSDTFKGSRGGNSSGPWLELDWARQKIDIPNNRSLIRLTLRLHSSYTLKFSASKSGTLHGSSFTYTGNFNGTGSKVISTRDVWVNHNADGSKSQTFSASFNIAVSWGGSQLSSISVSGTANITAIPRASTLSAFSFGGQLKNGTANSIKYTVDRKSGNFRHQIQLRDGNTTVWTWDNQNTDGTNTIPLTAANVNTLLSRMSTVTSKTFTLRVATRSGVGGGWIGSAVSKTAKAKVHDDVKPTVSALTVSQIGNAVSTHYLQGMSKVKASFTITSAGYGATIKSSSITVRRKTSNTDVQTINSNSGTTGKTVSLTGTYEARGTTRDSRGRLNYTAWKEFTVTAYSGPKITNFTAVRNATTPTTVNIERSGTHSHLGGSNVLTYTVQRRIGTGSWTNVNTNATGTSTTASFTGTSTSTGNSVTTSYDFRMVITDKFGESAESVVSVSTQRVVLDIHKNEGVGIGKIREQGVLDVDGSAFFKGDVNTLGSMSVDGVMDVQGRVILHGQAADVPLMVRGIEGKIQNSTQLDDLYLNYVSNKKVRIGKAGDEIIASGTNDNGIWMKFYDGTLICRMARGLVSSDMPTHSETGGFRSPNAINVVMPHSFQGIPSVMVAHNYGNPMYAVPVNVGSSSYDYYFYSRYSRSFTSGKFVNVTAVGRWK